jgi:hypothetical protein
MLAEIFMLRLEEAARAAKAAATSSRFVPITGARVNEDPARLSGVRSGGATK